MEDADEDFDCYLCQIYHDERHGNVVSFLTHWVDFADEERRIELRAASVTTYFQLLKGWKPEMSGSLSPIKSEIELWKFFIAGGAAAIEVSVAESCIPEKLTPQRVTSTGFGMFSPVSDVSQALQRAPTRKLRMHILERDRFRCRVCGQSSKTNVNIELHVHHIRPWENHGATTENNLVTLCHTCHGGLVPHWNPKIALFVEDLENDPLRWKTPPKFTLG